MFNPFLHVDCGERVAGIAFDHAGDARVDNQAFAHGAGIGVGNELMCLGLDADEVKRAADHVGTGSMDDGVGFGMYRTAEVISFAAGDLPFVPQAEYQVRAVLSPAGSAGVTGRKDLIIFHNYGPEIAPQAGPALGYRLGDIQIIILFISSRHGSSPSCCNFPFFMIHYQRELRN